MTPLHVIHRDVITYSSGDRGTMQRVSRSTTACSEALGKTHRLLPSERSDPPGPPASLAPMSFCNNRSPTSGVCRTL